MKSKLGFISWITFNDIYNRTEKGKRKFSYNLFEYKEKSRSLTPINIEASDTPFKIPK